MIKTCVSSYSFGWGENESREKTLTLIEKAAELGFDGIEFIEGALTNMENAHLIREKCAEVGITPVAFCVGANFAMEDEAALENEIKRVCGLVDIAVEMGVSMLRHDVAYTPFNRKYNTGYDAALPYMVKGIRAVADYAESRGIKTMTENHGYFSQDALRVEKLINAVSHPNFGALVDIGNFMVVDEDPCVSVGIMAPYAIHVHCKDFYFKSGSEIDPGEGWLTTRGGNKLRGCVIGFGAAKAAQSIGVLKRKGYDGYMTVEYEGGDDRMWALRVGKENLLRFIGEQNDA